MNRLDRSEARMLRHLVENRERPIADEELAEVVFQRPLEEVARSVEQTRFLLGMKVANAGLLKAAFTYYRGQFTVAVQWTPRAAEQSGESSRLA